jgi:outer membrane protein assembly factor BamB
MAEDWPQWRGAQRDGVWKEAGIVSDLPEGQMKWDWSVEIGTGYSGPTVAQGLVYVMDRQANGNDQTERVLCLDSKTGNVVWQHRYAAPYTIQYRAGPRASVTIDDGAAHAVGAMGMYHCFDAKTGQIRWSRDLNAEYPIDMPIWGIAASPLIYRNLVIQQVGAKEGACMVAMDKTSGKEVWRSLSERASYSSPIVIQQAGRDVLVCWTGDSLSGLNPSDGKVLWAHPMPPSRMPIGIGTPALDGELLFVSSFYDGSMMIRVPKDRVSSELVWRAVGKDEQHTESLHSMIGTSILQGGRVYGVDSYGEFRCLDALTGKRLWESQAAVPRARWSTIHMVRHGDQVWMFNERGELLLAKLSPTGLDILDRCQLIEPTVEQLPQRGGVCWSHPAFAEKAIFVRNDQRIVRASLAK